MSPAYFFIMKKTLIVGVGSVLMGDDGVGPRVIDELEKETLPEGIRLHGGDVSGMDLLKYFHGHDRVIIIDAANMNEKPGTIKILDLSEIKKADFNDKFSTHGMALLETLTLAKKLDMPQEIKIIAIQPENTGFSLELSDLIKDTIPRIIKEVKKLI